MPSRVEGHCLLRTGRKPLGRRRSSSYIANEIGTWSGTRPVNFTGQEAVVFVEISADGAWEIVFDELASAPFGPAVPGAIYEGVGSEVLFWVAEGPVIIDFDCPTCDSNVQITSWGERREGIVNEIGENGYSGTHVIPDGTILLEVDAHQDFNRSTPFWTMTHDG